VRSLNETAAVYLEATAEAEPADGVGHCPHSGEVEGLGEERQMAQSQA